MLFAGGISWQLGDGRKQSQWERWTEQGGNCYRLRKKVKNHHSDFCAS